MSRRAALIVWGLLVVPFWFAVQWAEEGGPILAPLVIVYLMGYFFAQAGPREGPSPGSQSLSSPTEAAEEPMGRGQSDTA